MALKKKKNGTNIGMESLPLCFLTANTNEKLCSLCIFFQYLSKQWKWHARDPCDREWCLKASEGPKHFQSKKISNDQELIQSDPISKAAGPDGIRPRVLKELSSELVLILTLLFKASLHQQSLPDIWKHSNVSPIYKKGDKTNPSNYRPVPLTCISCKLLEHIIFSNLNQHLKRNNILYPLQHGFRDKRSCETQLIEFVHDIAYNMQEGIQNGVVVMDFAKAFDKVAHNRLLYKLSSYGVKGNTLGWIGSFLCGRSQKVVLEGKSSSSVPVLSGVLQGSLLGPVLFLIYINDLPEYVSNSAVRLFADDTRLYLTIHNSSDCDKLQEDLNNLERWESDWQMSFHPEKCEVIHITTKKTPILHTYSLHGHILSSVPKIKYLGVHISQDLKWNSHINSTSLKANQT